MARVFLSYRRADGRYAVGWIAERLAQLDEVTDLRSAFQDGELRCGDDFPEALAEEIEGCDLLVAIIGPHWLGRRDDGTIRIKESNDWVAREISTALHGGKRVLPVLIEGTEPLSPDDLRDDLIPLTDLHMVPFDTEDDLDVLVDHLRSHLDEIDRDRARIAGLEDPIELRWFRPRPLAIVIAAVAAVAGALLGMAISQAFPGNHPMLEKFQQHDGLWVRAVVVETALWGALGAIGHAYLWTHFLGVARVRWRPVLLSFAFVGLLLAWVVGAFAEPPPLEWGGFRMWSVVVLALVLMAPWILILLGAAWTVPKVARYQLGARARLIGELGRAGTLAGVVIAGAAIPAVIAAGGLGRAYLRAGIITDTAPGVAITFGAFLSLAIAATMIWSRGQLRTDSTALAHDLSDIAPGLRRHAEAVLVTQPFYGQDWWLLAWLALPAIVAIPAAFWT